MNEPVLCPREPGRLFRHLLAWPLVAVVGFCSGDVRGAADQREGLRAGLARVRITPEKPLWLHGDADQTRFCPFEGKLNELFAKAMALEDTRGERAVLITLDLCVIRAAEAKALFGRLTERTGLQRRQLLVDIEHPGCQDSMGRPTASSARATMAATANTTMAENNLSFIDLTLGIGVAQ